MEPFNYDFLALRGIQAGKEYYVSMCPMKLIPKIFLYNEKELNPELRAQRTLNKPRIPEIAKYLLDNPKEYIFSAITASVDGEISFEPIDNDGNRNVGRLIIPMSSKFLINDGQHRRAAIEAALKERPDFGDETISVVFFLDTGLKRSQQMFADLNKHAVRPTKSLGILYDHRDPLSELTKRIIISVPAFNETTEMEKSTISNRSTKLFTLSSIYQATQALLMKKKADSVSQDEERRAKEFWLELTTEMTDWMGVKRGIIDTASLRKDFIHAHGVALHAIGIVGAAIIDLPKDAFREKIRLLASLDWSRLNAKLWEGRALVGGRVSKNYNNLILTVNAIKHHIGLKLSEEEDRIEMLWKRGYVK